ncbi:hypothetical protein E8E15_003637 [Penicillium rubens]|uniref:Uncharacterized protein n=1 Tax=Penicillium chrysogenum TaxID=5076 RepID=A0A167TR17_PENCH|nr:uncharacterized protein N7525_007258 [Penicillium rubens]KAF3027981.1 hypothetical protein E8E15_003637 [Penicillium rubens]KAJ5829005.1 hypothetical protein N7525_007258 [Penicillium rubens]KAJ5841298.1 hypothetical protein N7534_011128 [Penicillium rubens]KZN88530.1 hypothetical protein EN45_071050 [Penicillium chrysogenum]
MPPSRISTPRSVAVSPVTSPTETSALPPSGQAPTPKVKIIARSYGLQPGQPVMEDDDGWHTIFLSGNKFYLWGRMNDEVEEFVSQDIREIASSISQSPLRELARKPVA